MDIDADNNEPMQFAETKASDTEDALTPWKILVVDDEVEIHRVTGMALSSFTVLGRPLKLYDAYTGRESIEIMRREPDIALVLMDVVMETEHAGLDAVQTIRNELGNRFVRIVLRTGQPGQAPELEVVRRFDINDYKEKTELTTTKLYTVLQTGLSLYRELVAMDRNRIGLEQVIEASASIFNTRSLGRFQRGVLEQVSALLYARRDAVIVNASGVASNITERGLRVSAGTGVYQACEGGLAEEVLDAVALQHIRRAIERRSCDISATVFVAYFSTRLHTEHVVYLTSEIPFSPADIRLIELFCRNVAIALENLELNLDVLDSQRRLILLLSAAMEERSRELHNHVKRVSEYAKLLGRLLGLAEEDVETLGIAAAAHDLGKIAIPDGILNKPDRLSPEERALMETHVERGRSVLAGQKGQLMESTGATIGGHHEHWDGGGYPNRLSQEQIPLFARITGIADVFDALSTRRVYKQAWPLKQVREYFREQQGRQFDPQLTGLFLEHFEEFVTIRDRYPGDVGAERTGALEG
jgi:response regulator RpfG family c-di-GMP phosphodiesterase